ncbi:MAG: hypothetical protein GTO14_10670 [Anaerolineales bacterium]|nr:hypothetical protein [Anaerolineales bacterium]
MNGLKVAGGRKDGGRSMDSFFVNYLSGLRFGEPQTTENMGVLPLFVDVDESPDYVLLKEAIEEKQIIITEVSRHGSVPTLNVVNTSP